eukprot:scaffold106460_cov14-Tisochrysis_lutea.AAC.2
MSLKLTRLAPCSGALSFLNFPRQVRKQVAPKHKKYAEKPAHTSAKAYLELSRVHGRVCVVHVVKWVHSWEAVLLHVVQRVRGGLLLALANVQLLGLRQSKRGRCRLSIIAQRAGGGLLQAFAHVQLLGPRQGRRG